MKEFEINLLDKNMKLLQILEQKLTKEETTITKNAVQ